MKTVIFGANGPTRLGLLGRIVVISTTQSTPTLRQMVRREALSAKDSDSIPTR